MAKTNNFNIHLSEVFAKPMSGAGINRVFTGQISKDTVNKVYGGGKDFLDRYSKFENDYQKALRRNLDPAKVAGVDMDFLRSGGAINLNVLTQDVREKFQREYFNDILRLPNVFKEVGAPGIQLPSANQYRYAARYAVETGERIAQSCTNIIK